MINTQTTGILENPDGFLWLVRLTQGHAVTVGIEEWEGKLVKVTRNNNKIIIEKVMEIEPVIPQARELCMAGG